MPDSEQEAVENLRQALDEFKEKVDVTGELSTFEIRQLGKAESFLNSMERKFCEG